MAFTRRKCLSLSELIALGSGVCQCWQSALTSALCLPCQCCFGQRAVFIQKQRHLSPRTRTPRHKAEVKLMEVWMRERERQRKRGTIETLLCCTSGRVMLKIHCAPALFREQRNWIYPDLRLLKSLLNEVSVQLYFYSFQMVIYWQVHLL